MKLKSNCKYSENDMQSLVTNQNGLARCGKKCTRLLVTASYWLTVVAPAEEGGLESLSHDRSTDGV